MSCAKDSLLYRHVSSIKAGNVQRFEISYTPPPLDQGGPLSSLWVKIRNREPLPMRAAFLAGPCLLYVDCRSENYLPNEKCFITADQPKFESQLIPGKSFYCELSCHTFKETHKWTVDVVSQILFNTTIEVSFEVSIGTSKAVLHEAAVSEGKVLNSDKVGVFAPETLRINHLDTLDLWNTPVPQPNKPIHLVILTHGLHSNVSADLLFLKESIDAAKSNQNIVVKGYTGNICKTERGIKYLGSRVAEYIVDLVTNNETLNRGRVNKISFIGHSLGGLVQTFAIAYLQNNFPWFFKTIKPINFITLASPMLGVSKENPIYINLAMQAGIVGKTGQDLSLKYMDEYPYPLLLVLPTGPTHKVLKQFVNRTVYANVINDGVVSLRTAALLYLDYKGMSSVLSKEAMLNHHIDQKSDVNKIPDDDCADNSNSSYIPQVFQALKTYFLPQRQAPPKNEKMQPADSEDTVEESETLVKTTEIMGIEKLPKTSMLDTLAELVLPNLPTLKHITDPDSRDEIIVYDKVYSSYETLPDNGKSDFDERDSMERRLSDASLPDVQAAQHPSTMGIRHRIMNTLDYEEFERIEEEIARRYHKGMSWRKVLVKLKPDAHNNMIVRRRFSNAYGWGVIDHLVQNHFEVDVEEDETSSNWNLDQGIGLLDSSSFNQDLTGILSRDLIKRQNENIDKDSSEVSKEHHWINSKDNSDSLFAVGPTGLLSDVSDLLTNLKDQWYNGQSQGGEETPTAPNPDQLYDRDLDVTKQGNFI